MNQTATIVPLTHASPAIEPATVHGACDQHGYLPVCREGESVSRRARMAIYPRPSLAPGDEVLTLSDSGGSIYIVGVIACKEGDNRDAEEIRLTDGSKARVGRDRDRESLKIYSPDDELLVEYNSTTGTMTVNAASGNLEFSAPQGGIAFRSAEGIKMDGRRVSLNARTDLHMGVQHVSGSPGTALTMHRQKMQITAPAVDLTAQRSQFVSNETDISGSRLRGRIGDVQLIVRKFESVAETVMAKAKNVYRTVTQLSQLKAGRQRTLIDTTSHTKAQKTIVKSETDFKVKAEKIHLG